MDKRDIIKAIEQGIHTLPVQVEAQKISGKKIILTQCDIVAYEVFVAAGFTALKMPRWVIQALIMCDSPLYRKAVEFCSMADLIIAPASCTLLTDEITNTMNVHQLHRVEGFAQDAAVNMHGALHEVMQTLGISEEFPPADELKQAVALYEEIRMIMRNITTFHAHALSNEELHIVCDAAFALIPQQSLALLRQLKTSLDSAGGEADAAKTKALAYMDFAGWDMLDDAAGQGGIVIAEDDGCNGRRQFDISCPAQSRDVYYELLYAYSFKSWCPGMRRASERFELIYKPLSHYNIGLVILSKSFLESRNAHITCVYEHCLLQGTDAVVIENLNTREVYNHLKALKNRHHHEITIDY